MTATEEEEGHEFDGAFAAELAFATGDSSGRQEPDVTI